MSPPAAPPRVPENNARIRVRADELMEQHGLTRDEALTDATRELRLPIYPEVGMAAYRNIGSDSYACRVYYVSPSGKTVWVFADEGADLRNTLDHQRRILNLAMKLREAVKEWESVEVVGKIATQLDSMFVYGANWNQSVHTLTQPDLIDRCDERIQISTDTIKRTKEALEALDEPKPTKADCMAFKLSRAKGSEGCYVYKRTYRLSLTLRDRARTHLDPHF